MVTLHEPATGELPACSYELVGVFDLNRVVAEFGSKTAAEYATTGNPRKCWNGKSNGFTRSFVLKPIPGRESDRHPPFAVFVATDSVNSEGNYPPRSELLAYREEFSCLACEDHWSQWSEVVSAFTDATKMSNFISMQTTHSAEITWTWSNEKLHDGAYHSKVHDAVDLKVREVCAKSQVSNDIRYCCQWEGVQLQARTNLLSSLRQKKWFPYCLDLGMLCL